MTTVEYTDYLGTDELQSSALSDAYYDEKNARLYVRFHTGGLAGYKSVSKSIWEQFKHALSHGRFYTYNIRNVYAGIDTTGITFRSASKAVSAVNASDKIEYVLEVKYNGTLEFKVKATDVKSAIEEVERTLAQTGQGTSVFTKVEAV